MTIPAPIRTLFWDIDLDTFKPEEYPDYTIFRVLEYGNEEAVAWMRQIFSVDEIQRVLRSEHRLSPKSANFWALVYGLSSTDISALNERR